MNRDRSPDRSLAELARLFGVLPVYVSNDGAPVAVAADTLQRVLRALGVDPRDPTSAARERRTALWREVVPPVAVSWVPGPARLRLRLPEPFSGRASLRLECEDGARREHDLTPLLGGARRFVRHVDGATFARLDVTLPDELPAGYHRGVLRLEGEAAGAAGESTFLWIAAPQTAQEVEGRSIGVFAPLYALHSRRRPDCGDLTDWLRLSEWAGRAGVRLLGALPLCAAFLDEPVEPSPYAPVSRLFWNDVYVDHERLPEFAASPAAREAAAAAPGDGGGEGDGEAADGSAVDWPAVAARRGEVLARCAAQCFDGNGGEAPADLQAWLAERPEALTFARYRAIQERHGRNWRAWPDAVREDLATDDFDEGARRRHLYGQWRAQQQFAAATRQMAGHGVGFYLDLPIGVHPDGYDAWRYRAQFVNGCSAGAPPDPFFTLGQDWGFAPLHPRASRAAGHEYFRATLRHQLAHCGALRVDHVMGLYRVWCVPHGTSADRGCYVRQPAEELFAVLTLESRRAGCAVIGEDLGTVPVAVRRLLDRHRVLSMHIVQFSLHEHDAGPALSPGAGRLAALNTHDMPTFAAFWQAADVAGRQQLGLLDDDGARAERERRGRLVDAARRFLGIGPGQDGEAVQRGLEALARSDAEIVVFALEDLWGETRPQNVPGTGAEQGNWQRRMQRSLDEIVEDDGLRDRIAAIVAARAR